MAIYTRYLPSARLTRSQIVLLGAIFALLLTVEPWSTAANASQSPSTGGPGYPPAKTTLTSFPARGEQHLVSAPQHRGRGPTQGAALVGPGSGTRGWAPAAPTWSQLGKYGRSKARWRFAAAS